MTLAKSEPLDSTITERRDAANYRLTYSGKVTEGKVLENPTYRQQNGTPPEHCPEFPELCLQTGEALVR